MTEPCEFCGGAVGQYPHGCPGCSAPQCCQRCCNGGSPSLIEQFRRMRADLDRTAAERDALRADAERYRWLRSHSDGFWSCHEKDGYGGDVLKYGEDLDAAIDAAMRGEG